MLRSLILFLLFPLVMIGQDATDKLPTKIKPLDASFFKNNRENFRSKMPDRSVALIFSGTEKIRSNDVNYPFHQDPNFYYLTGFNEPNALLIVFKEPYELNKDLVREIIFVPGRSKDFERWNGIRLGTVGVKEYLGFESVFMNSDFADQHFKFDLFDEIFYSIPNGIYNDNTQDRGDISSQLKHFKFKTDSLSYKVDDLQIGSWLAQLREIKFKEEIDLIQKAIDITCVAQRDLMDQIDTSFAEYMAEAIIEFNFRNQGAESPGFPSIVGGGANSCILHYVENKDKLNDGDLLVVDVGAEYQNYTADVTRTIPVNGKFSEEQAIIYNLVLEAQKAGIEKCRKGNKFWDPHEAAEAVIQKGLKNLGITKKAYESKKYFMHGTSHYLGLDVHDAGSYQPLRVNNIITVEPGIYIPKGSDCDEKWWDIGIRIEDDILITENLPVNLSQCVPREIEEIEEIMHR